MKFNQELFDTSDEEGKGLLIAFLEKKGHIISQNSDKYGIDLFSEKDGKTYNWEVEMKSRRPWTSMADFPFESVSFLKRKSKWDNFWYVIICRETRAAIVCHSSVIFDEDYKEKIYIKTSYRNGSDNFYRVPKEKCIFVSPNEFIDER